MLQITLDIFSGRANPMWVVTDDSQARNLLTEVARYRSAITEPGRGYQGLGFRGVTLELTEDVESTRYSLPAEFVIAGGGSTDEAKGREIAEEIIRSMNEIHHSAILTPGLDSFDSTLVQAVLTQLANSANDYQSATDSNVETNVLLQAAAVSCSIELGKFNPGFWNDPAYVRRNNCYNYATTYSLHSLAIIYLTI